MRFSTFSFEPTTSGKLMLGMMFGQSKYYVDNLSENIKRGIRQKVRSGIWPSSAPIGYLNDRKNRMIVPCPERGPLVRRAFELYAPGDYMLARIRSVINDAGLTGVRGGRLTKGHYQRFLQNPVYCGLLRYNGELHEGQHEPLISKKLFDRVQEVMHQKSRPKSGYGSTYLYLGMFHCGNFGAMITNETQKGHVYLRCTRKKGPCEQPYLREEDMTRQVEAGLRSVVLDPEDADWMLAELRERQDKERHTAEAAAAEVRRELSELDAKDQRLLTGYLEGVSSLDEYRSLKNQFAEKRATLKERLASIEASGERRLEPVGRP
jgi:hypothetical protein